MDFTHSFIGSWVFDAPVTNLQPGWVYSTEQSGLIAFRKFQSCGSSIRGYYYLCKCNKREMQSSNAYHQWALWYFLVAHIIAFRLNT